MSLRILCMVVYTGRALCGFGALGSLFCLGGKQPSSSACSSSPSSVSCSSRDLASLNASLILLVLWFREVLRLGSWGRTGSSIWMWPFPGDAPYALALSSGSSVEREDSRLSSPSQGGLLSGLRLLLLIVESVRDLRIHRGLRCHKRNITVYVARRVGYAARGRPAACRSLSAASSPVDKTSRPNKDQQNFQS